MCLLVGGLNVSYELYSFLEDGRLCGGSIFFVIGFFDCKMYMYFYDIFLGCRFLVCRFN